MPLFLNESEVAQLLTMPLAIDAVEEAHRALSLGNAVDVPRERTRLQKTALHILQGALPESDAIGYKAYTSNRSGNRFLVHVFSASSGALRVVIEANLLGMVRTGAASAVATRYLARPDAEVLGVFGAGWQAEGNIEAIAAVRALKKIKVFARDAGKLPDFCAKMAKRLGLEVVSAASAEETVRGSDIVSTITTAAAPLFDAKWLEPGTHINAAGSNAIIRREIGEDVLKRCARIVVDSVDTALKEAGDLLPLLEKGRLDERHLVELGDVLVGLRPGRSSSDEITIFESQGLAIQDLAVAVRLEALAREKNLGLNLPYGG
ncbi:MAG: ornithine cyclodeaminase family protein [Candidatus Accumulibacter sp.]|jgi:ornithine cyclodeaminase|nr:ornithine cyclodeaminase family protein [Accumulibacter sp.]